MYKTATAIRRFWSQLLGKGHLVLFLSLLPSLLYLGHWSAFVAPSPIEEMSHQELEAHESHCHLGAGGCSEQPVPANLRVLGTVVQLPRPALQSTPIEGSALLLEEAIVITPTEPPRA